MKCIELFLAVESGVNDYAGFASPYQVGEFLKSVAAKFLNPYHNIYVCPISNHLVPGISLPFGKNFPFLTQKYESNC